MKSLVQWLTDWGYVASPCLPGIEGPMRRHSKYNLYYNDPNDSLKPNAGPIDNFNYYRPARFISDLDENDDPSYLSGSDIEGPLFLP
jgi:hypothetical protein